MIGPEEEDVLWCSSAMSGAVAWHMVLGVRQVIEGVKREEENVSRKAGILCGFLQERTHRVYAYVFWKLVKFKCKRVRQCERRDLLGDIVSILGPER